MAHILRCQTTAKSSTNISGRNCSASSPHFESIGVAQGRDRKIAAHNDFDNGQIGLFNAADDLGRELAVIV
jgi:hypothetical protein